MGNFEKRLRAVSRVGTMVGVVFLVAIMLLTVANITERSLLGGVIHGSWEVSGLMLVVVAVFAMLNVVLERGNIRVTILVDKLHQRIQEILEMFNSVISLGVMVVILWATVWWITKGAFRGKTAALGVPFLPFQIIWISGLLTLCLALLIEAYKALRRR